LDFTLIASLAGAGLFVLMLVASELGRRVGIARLARDAKGLAKGAASAEAAVFGLLGLLIAFTFSGAASRFEDRRHLIVQEANAIGTAYLRIDVLAPDAQPEIRSLFRRYIDARVAAFQGAEDKIAARPEIAAGATLQAEIWRKSVVASQSPGAAPQAPTLMLPALNDMIDITTTRQMATQNHPPIVVFLLLGALSFLGATLVGYSSSPNRERSWFHIAAFAAILSLTVYVIIDLEFPRLGFIRIDAADQVLRELKESIQ
jgi:hypothetical protein